MSIFGNKSKANAANQAASQQMAAADKGVNEVNSGFDYIKNLIQPFIDSGKGALTAQNNILGINGGDQNAEIQNLQNSPMFQALLKQGNDSILQNASATGGLRGGNTEAALSQFSPQLLNQFIQQRFQNLGGITDIGLTGAGQVGQASQAKSQAVANLYGQSGAAQAGGTIAAGNKSGNNFASTLGTLGTIASVFKF